MIIQLMMLLLIFQRWLKSLKMWWKFYQYFWGRLLTTCKILNEIYLTYFFIENILTIYVVCCSEKVFKLDGVFFFIPRSETEIFVSVIDNWTRIWYHSYHRDQRLLLLLKKMKKKSKRVRGLKMIWERENAKRKWGQRSRRWK